MNMADVVVILAVLAVAAVGIMILRNNKKQGKSSCGCDCSGCGRDCCRK